MPGSPTDGEAYSEEHAALKLFPRAADTDALDTATAEVLWKMIRDAKFSEACGWRTNNAGFRTADTILQEHLFARMAPTKVHGEKRAASQRTDSGSSLDQRNGPTKARLYPFSHFL
jgi:hypothetical protein